MVAGNQCTRSRLGLAGAGLATPNRNYKWCQYWPGLEPDVPCCRSLAFPVLARRVPDVPCWGWSRYWPGLEPDVPCRPPGRVPVLARPEPDVPCWPRVLHGVSHLLPMRCHRRWFRRTGLAEPGSLLTWAGSQYWPGFSRMFLAGHAAGWTLSWTGIGPAP